MEKEKLEIDKVYKEIVEAIEKDTWPIGMGKSMRAMSYCDKKFRQKGEEIPTEYKTIIDHLIPRCTGYPVKGDTYD